MFQDMYTYMYTRPRDSLEDTMHPPPTAHPHIKYGSYAIEYRRKIAEFVDKHL